MKGLWAAICQLVGVPAPTRQRLTAELAGIMLELENAESEALYWAEWAETLRLRKTRLETALKELP